MRAGALLTVVGTLLAALGVHLIPRAVAEQRGEPGDSDSLEPRRVLLTPQHLPAVLERARQGVLVKLSLPEFEERLRRARAARKLPLVPPPRLATAHYRATLVEGPPGEDVSRGSSEPYLRGTGHWQVLHSGTAPGVLPLRPLSLALRQPRFENRDALVGAFEGETPGLLLDRAGKQAVMFDWTTRGDRTPEGIQFDWRVPATPVALLELDLPAGRALAVTPESCLVEGPLQAESSSRSLWKVHFANRSILHLTVVPLKEARATRGGTLRVEQVRGRHTLAPDGEASDFTFDVRVVAPGVRALTFACDAPLTPYRVTLPADGPARLEGWDFEPARKPGQRSRLTVRLRRAVSGTLHPRIYCRAPLGPARVGRPGGSFEYREWSCPGLALLPGSPPRSETVEVRCRPGLRLENWRPGAFRLTGVETEADGTYRLTLTGTGLPAGPKASTRPGALLRTRGADYRTRVLAWWQVGGASSTLTAQIVYDVRYGRLFELPLLVSAGWEVERVWCPGPPERLRNYTARPARANGKPATLLTAELQVPLETGAERSTLFVQLRERHPRGPARGQMPFPLVVPAGGEAAEGGLAVDWDDELFAASFTSPPQKQRGKKRPQDVLLVPGRPPLTEGPWGQRVPRAYFSWRGQPLPGTLHLQPRPARLRTHSLNELHQSPGRLDLVYRLRVAVEAGAADTIDVRLSAPLPPGTTLRWDTPPGAPSVRAFERRAGPSPRAALTALAAASPLEGAALWQVYPAAEHWRLTLTRPLRAHKTIALRAGLHMRWPPGRGRSKRGAGASGAVPLITFAGPGRTEGEVRLYRARGELPAQGLRTGGLREPAGAVLGNGLHSGRVFSHDTPAVSLELGGAPGSAEPGWSPKGLRASGVISRASLLVRVDPGGRLVHHYAFEVRDWPQPTLPLRLPPGTRLAAVRVDGQDATGSLPGHSWPNGHEAEGEEVLLPVPDRAGGTAGVAHYFEVLYVKERAPWRLWARLEARPPVTPVRPRTLRRVWRLPSGYVPVRQLGYLRLPGPTAPGSPIPSPAALAARALSMNRWAARQEQAVRAADTAFRRAAAGQRRTLAEALQALTAAGLTEEGENLLVDVAALRAAGLSLEHSFVVEPPRAGPPETALSSLGPLGLVYVPFRPAAVLTTRQQWQEWQRLRGTRSLPPEGGPLAAAVTEAATYGHDASGRFRTVPDWLCHGRNALPQPALLEELAPGDDLVAWVDWEVTPAIEEDAPLEIVRATLPGGVGLGLAGLFLLAGWWVGHVAGRAGWRESGNASADKTPARRGPLRLVLVWLAAAGLGWLWLPVGLRDLAWWPLVSGCAVALWWYLVPRTRSLGVRPLQARPRSFPASIATAGVLALFWTGWAAGPAAQPSVGIRGLKVSVKGQGATSGSSVNPSRTPRPLRPEDRIIYLVPGAGAKKSVAVLVTPAYLERLGWRRKPLSLPGATLIGAEYRGIVKKHGARSARFEAVFQVYCPAAGPVTLELPLDGVVLDQEALLNGARSSLTPTRAGYAIKVTGAGLHKVQLSFVTPVVAAGEAFETRFTVPGVAQSRLALRLPPGTAFPQALVKLGSQRVTNNPGGSLLEVDVGAFTAAAPGKATATTVPLHLRWRQARPGRRPSVRFWEAYLWDLGQRGHSLTGVVLFRVGPGSTARLSLDIPRHLVVGRVEARQPPPARLADGPSPVRLRDWHLAAAKGRKGPRTLHLDFHAPVSGNIQILLVLHPVDGLFDVPARTPATVTLPLPRPHGTPVPREGYLAYRLQGLEAQRIQAVRVIGIAARSFPASFWLAVGRGEPPDYAGRIIRERDQGPILRLAVRVRPARREGSLRLAWRLGARHADLRAALDLKAPGGDLALVEWEIPAAVEVTGVRGPDVREWSRMRRPGGGSRVQVWLRRSVARVRLELTAEVPLARLPGVDRAELATGAALAVALRDARARSGLFALRAVRVVGRERNPLATTVELTAREGLALMPRGLRSLRPQPPGSRFPAARLTYIVRREDYGGLFAVGPARLPAVKVVTVVEVKGRLLEFRTRIEASATAGSALRTLGIRLRDWPGANVALAAPGAVLRPGPHGDDPRAARLWQVDWEANTPASAVLTLTGRVSLDDALVAGGDTSRAAVVVPDVHILGASSVERWLATGKGASRFLLEGGGQRGKARRVQGTGGRRWRLGESATTLLLREQAGAAAPVRVLLREHVAAVLDGQRWLHQTTWWLYHEKPATLTFTLPAGVLMRGVAVDGVERSLAGAGRGVADTTTRLSLGGSGARLVSVRWAYPVGSEDLAQPILKGPHLEGAEGPVAWTLHAPPGFRAAPGAFHTGPLAVARLEVERGRAQYRLTRLLLESAAGPLARKADERREKQVAACQQRFARHARNGSQLLRSAGEAGKELAVRLEKLRRENRALIDAHGLRNLRRRAEQSLREEGRERNGTDAVWNIEELVESGRPFYRVAGDREKAVVPVGAPTLVAGTDLERRRALAATGLLLGLLVAVWVLSGFPAFVRLTHLFWPEQMVVLGLLGYQTFGVTWTVVFLVMLGLMGRLLSLGAVLLAFLYRPRTPHPQRA